MRFSIILPVLVVLSTACSTSKKAAVESKPMGPVGVWEAVVSGTPMGDVPIEINLMQEGELYKGFIMANGQKMDLRDVMVEGDKMSASFYAAEFQTDINFDATYKSETDSLEGWVMESYRLTGKRKSAVK